MIIVFYGLALIGVVGIAIGAYVKIAPQFGARIGEERQIRLQESANYAGGSFTNLHAVSISLNDNDRPPFEAMRKFWFGKQDRTPASPLPILDVSVDRLLRPQAEGAAITWLGHSSVLIEINGCSLLTDPMFGRRASPFSFLGPKRFSKKFPLPIEKIERLDAIVISHDHYDHLDYMTIQQLHSKTDTFFVPLGVADHLLRWGVAKAKIVELDWWQKTTFMDDIELIAAPTQHFSGRRIGDRFQTLWASWIIRTSKQSLYFGGDSGYSASFKEIGEKYGPFDITMLECGAYSEYWPYIHMMPEQTVQAHIDLNGKLLIPIHWAQFNLSIHPWTQPVERLLANAELKNINIATPRIGERFAPENHVPMDKWWKKLK